jgi:hypothetical protein
MAKLQAERGTEAKILRIGIIQSGKIVEERLVRKRENVTIGQSAKNTFVVPASNYLGRSFVLFELGPAGYALNFTDGMDGRVSLGDQVVALPALRQAGKAQKKGELWHLQLTDRSRGKVVIGDVTVLFQFVAPPPVQPRPQLPPSVRSSLMQNLDWMLVATVGASFLLHFGFAVYLRNVDWPRKPDIEELPDRFVQMIVPPKKIEEKKPEIAKVEDKGAAEEKKKDKGGGGDGKKAGGPKAPRDPEAEARAAAERRARLAADVQKMGVLKLLGAKGEGGTVADLVKGGDVSGDADAVFKQVGGVGVAGSGSAGGLRSAKGAGGTGSLRGGGSLRAEGPGTVGTGEKGGERAVKAVIKDSAPVDVDGSLDPSVIVKEIRSRIGAVKACYEAGLKRNPSIGGKVTLRFEVSTVGKVTSAEIENDTMKDDEVTGCIRTRVLSWRFPAPAGGSAQFSYPFIFQASK